MPDREKVIKGLTVCSEHGLLNGEDCNGHYEYTDNLADIIKANDYSKQCPYNGCETGCVKTLAKDVFALLNEQEAEIEQLNRFVNGFSRDAMPVVRCKDCKFQVDRGRRYPECDKHFILAKDYWFCADGELR